ncbi:MAG: HI0074 family nucleotidyltransferase substrate-binding subunit [bacterium]
MDLKKFNDFSASLKKFKEAYEKTIANIENSDYFFFRDSSIQRFEFTVEIFWKLLKNILQDNEGIFCNSPKSCVREFFALGHIKESNTKILLEMLDDRNLTSHTYHEEIAEIIFLKFKNYINNLEYFLDEIKSKFLI